MKIIQFKASKSLLVCTFITFYSFFNTGAHAQAVVVKDAWVRATVPGQMATGAFLTLTAKADAQLVSVSTPAAGIAEVHEMKMEGDVMKMRALPRLELPAGKAVELKPSGFHVMLMDLRAPLVKGSKLPLMLVFKDTQGAESRMTVSVPVSNIAPGTVPSH